MGEWNALPAHRFRNRPRSLRRRRTLDPTASRLPGGAHWSPPSGGVPLRLLDQHPPASGPPAGAEFVQADLRDLDAIEKATTGISAVVHLAGLTHEGPFAENVEHNITGTHHVLEAARRQHMPRLVLASSHHVTGLNPVGAPAAPLAPDSFYAVAKVTAEALGHLYAHKTAMQVVAVRIGSYRDATARQDHLRGTQ